MSHTPDRARSYRERQGRDEVQYFGLSGARFESGSNIPSSLQMPRLSSHASTASSSTGRSNTSSRKAFSVSSSMASTVDMTPPVQLFPTLNQHIQQTSSTDGYDLPCEFEFIGCSLRFQPQEVELWIAHSISHFGHYPPPPKSACSFCDHPPFKSYSDAISAWRNRMIHIESHLQNYQAPKPQRPDFLTIEYMLDRKLMSSEDYNWAASFTERPYCPGLVPNDYETKDMKRRREKGEKASHEYHNLKDEDRQKRKRHDKKTRHTTSY